MSKAILHPPAGNGNIQTGPVYHCPQCAVPCTGIVSAEQAHAPFGGVPRWMGDWAEHVAYLERPRRCKQEHHFGGAGRPSRRCRPAGRLAGAHAGRAAGGGAVSGAGGGGRFAAGSKYSGGTLRLAPAIRGGGAPGAG